MTLYRSIPLTRDEEAELLGLHRSFRAAQTASHDDPEERWALERMLAAQDRIAAAKGLDPRMLSVSFGGRDYPAWTDSSGWAVSTVYPLAPEDEQGVRGLG